MLFAQALDLGPGAAELFAQPVVVALGVLLGGLELGARGGVLFAQALDLGLAGPLGLAQGGELFGGAGGLLLGLLGGGLQARPGGGLLFESALGGARFLQRSRPLLELERGAGLVRAGLVALALELGQALARALLLTLEGVQPPAEGRRSLAGLAGLAARLLEALELRRQPLLALAQGPLRLLARRRGLAQPPLELALLLAEARGLGARPL